MKKVWIALAGILLSSSLQAANLKLVRDYITVESIASLADMGAYTIAGRTGTVEERSYFIEVYKSDSLEMVRSIPLPHRPSTFDIQDDCKLMTFGAMSVSHVDICAGRVTKTIPFGGNRVAHGSISVNQNLYLISEPNEGLIAIGNNVRPIRIGKHISPLFSMSKDNQGIWVTSYNNLWKVDVTRQTKTPVFESGGLYGYTHQLHLDNKRMALSVYDDKALVLYNKSTQTVDTHVDLQWHPGAITPFGSCLAVARPHEKEVVIFAGSDRGKLFAVTSYDLNDAGDKLKLPEYISFSEATGTLFVKSAYPCPTCSVTQSSLFALQLAGDDLPAECF